MPLQASQRPPIVARGACRTCKTCRRKKVKCEGQKPECSTCRARGWVCEYPEDGRKTAVRSKKADIRSLQRQIEELKGQMKEQLSTNDPSDADHTNPTRVSNESVNVSHHLSLIPSYEPDPSPRTLDWQDLSPPRRGEESSTARPSLGDVQEPAEGHGVSSPEPQVDNSEMQIYGGTSLLHDRSNGDFWSNPPSKVDENDAGYKSAARDRLISQAALSRQKEVNLCSNPSLTANIDFDGIPMNLAMHLLDLHWSRLHLIYLQSYRPAIIDSLINNGPYVSKLLLNAIYLQSSLYSDREGLRLDSQDPRTTGMAFYKRFKTLVAECIDEPTMPTVLGLLICGTCLVPYGKQSAGWVYCGMAYRMMVDLGYHLNIPKTPQERAKFGLSATDIEIRRRIYWGAYISDKYQSLWIGRAPAVHESDSNIPEEFLDSFDEMGQWTPYVDPEAQSLSLGLLVYQPRPCYALSTFQSLLRLSIIAAQVIDDLYSVKSATAPQSILLQKKRELTARLTEWNENLPAHLRFDPDKDNTPPPHQLNLHITSQTLVILVEQAFLNRVHFNFTLDQASQEKSCKNCIKAAFKIWRLLEAYKKTFTLRHAHYGEFYAAYSAVLVILQQAPENHEEYIECIKFFWSMLSEPQRRSLGFALGLKKPFRLLKARMRRMNFVAEQINLDEPENPVDGHHPSGETLFNRSGKKSLLLIILIASPTWTDAALGWQPGGPVGSDAWPQPWYDTMTDNMFFADHSMFGLFTQ
ncbi:hypothetical protein LTR84_012319 [Exophiala bonariae]|uniref:Zn(2)-C6 fungal-type domain-containing protein n=1 Tax=Exophiala bonariae TaxID=1690606 RepID=A0AAV9NFV7_9EURO|nr:hypothetical protein LTR84_012319 [Exophiala bonariae]